MIKNIKSLERYCKDNLVFIQLILIDERCVKFENNLRNDKKYINELKNSKYITFHNPFKNPKLKYFLYPIEKILRKYDQLDVVLMGFGQNPLKQHLVDHIFVKSFQSDKENILVLGF